MRRAAIGITALLTIVGPLALGPPAQAARPGPQCGAVLPCDGPVQKIEDKVQDIVETCQKAYCESP